MYNISGLENILRHILEKKFSLYRLYLLAEHNKKSVSRIIYAYLLFTWLLFALRAILLRSRCKDVW